MSLFEKRKPVTNIFCSKTHERYSTYKKYKQILRDTHFLSEMPSFFTVPASQRKRKRDSITAATSAKRQTPTANKSQKNKPPKPDREESISESDSEDERRWKKPADFEENLAGSSEDDDETGAERRLRLAERYLEKVKGQVEEEVGFDAEEVDRDLIDERLKEDVVCCNYIPPDSHQRF